MNKKVLAIVLTIIVVLGSGYYFFQRQETKNNVKQGDTIEITHKLAKEPVKVAKNPKTTIVFDYGTLDTLDTLGVEVAGVAKSSLPSYLSKYKDDKYEDIGTLFEPNFETIAKIAPDVIFISGRQASVYEELAKIAPTVYFEIDPADYMTSLVSNVNAIAEIYGKEDVAAKELQNLIKKVNVIQEKVDKLDNSSTLITLTNDGEISAYGGASRFGIIHNALNFKEVDENIEATNHGQQVSYEYIVEKNPAYIFVVDRNKAIGEGQDGSKVFENELMKQVDAYKNNHIVFLDQEAWYLASGGLQSTNIMLDDIASVLK